MLAKFENPETMVSPEKLTLMTAWSDMCRIIRPNHSRIMRINSDLIEHRLFGAEGHHLNFPLVFEQRLSVELPEVAAAAQGLKRAFDAFRGWQIDWRQRIPGEAVAFETKPVTADASMIRVIRGPEQSYEENGYIVDTKVGPDEFMALGLKTWVEVAQDPDAERGAMYDFDHMLMVRLTPLEI